MMTYVILSNFEKLYFIWFFISVTLTVLKCSGRKKPTKKMKSESAKFDHTQSVEKIENPDGWKNFKHDAFLANVELLLPNVPGGCTDDNAAKEAMHRHKTNEYWPKLEIQKNRIVNKTTKKEMRAMIEALPKHPPVKYMKKERKSLEKRKEKYKDCHVTWHTVGLVYIVRGRDLCRSKDDAGADTADTPEVQSPDEIPSEIPMSKANSKKKMKRASSKMRTPMKSEGGEENMEKTGGTEQTQAADEPANNNNNNDKNRL